MHPALRRTALAGAAAVMALGALTTPALATPAPATPAPATPAPAAGTEPSPAAPAPAAGPSTWTVQPSSAQGPSTRAHFVYDLAPGQTVSDYVGVTNLSERPLTLKVSAGDAFTTDTGGFDLLAAGTPSTDVGSWVKLTQTEITVPARRRLDVPFTLTVPAGATPGDHAGGIVASLVAAATTADGGQVSVDNRVGSRLYLRVAGPLRPAATVTQLQTAYDGVANPVGTGAVDVAYTIRNSGNTRLSGRVTAEVQAPFGFSVKTVDLGVLPELLPGNAFNGTTTLASVAPLIRLDTRLTVAPTTISGEPGSEGSVGAVLDPVERSSAFWAVPWNLLTVVVVALALLVWRLRLRVKGRKGGQGTGGPGRTSDEPAGPTSPAEDREEVATP